MRKSVYRPQDHGGYARAVVVEYPDRRDVSMAGVIATDPEGDIVGPNDIHAQTRQVYENIQGHLDALGGELTDIVRHRVFVTTMADDAIDAFHAAHGAFFDAPERFPAGTLVEIDGLVLADAMIEIEIEAVIPDDGWETSVVRGAER